MPIRDRTSPLSERRSYTPAEAGPIRARNPHPLTAAAAGHNSPKRRYIGRWNRLSASPGRPIFARKTRPLPSASRSPTFSGRSLPTLALRSKTRPPVVARRRPRPSTFSEKVPIINKARPENRPAPLCRAGSPASARSAPDPHPLLPPVNDAGHPLRPIASETVRSAGTDRPRPNARRRRHRHRCRNSMRKQSCPHSL